MSGENNFSKEGFLKKVQEGDSTLLIVGAILMIVPLIALLVLTSAKPDKKAAQQRLKTLTQRKNVFNFGTKSENGKKTGPKSGMPSSTSNWFGGSPEQRAQNELQAAAKVIEKRAKEVHVPLNLTGDARKQYIAENNYNLCMANGALEAGRYDEAEDFLKEALEEAKDNDFLRVYALGSLCALYERTGDKAKMEQAYKMYFDAVSKLPPEYGGQDLKTTVRDVYQGLLVLGKHASESDLSEALSKEPLYRSGKLPSNINIREVYKDFPIKYE